MNSPHRATSAFCALPLPTNTRHAPTCCPLITMRKPKKRSNAPGPKGPSRLPSDKESRIEDLATRYGVRPPRPGDGLDRRYSTPTTTPPPPRPTLYQALAAAVGVDALVAGERVLCVVLGLLLAAFLAGGLAISAEAFLKASGREIPDAFDSVVTSIERAFTPTVLVFLALSSLLGVYKQSQLASGATSYEALSKEEEEE